jgi:hypothetical protein
MYDTNDTTLLEKAPRLLSTFALISVSYTAHKGEEGLADRNLCDSPMTSRLQVVADHVRQDLVTKCLLTVSREVVGELRGKT